LIKQHVYDSHDLVYMEFVGNRVVVIKINVFNQMSCLLFIKKT